MPKGCEKAMAGSIEKRSENTYNLTVSAGKNLDGSRARKTMTFHVTYKEAQIELVEFMTEVNHGLIPESKSVTFEDFSITFGKKNTLKKN